MALGKFFTKKEEAVSAKKPVSVGTQKPVPPAAKRHVVALTRRPVVTADAAGSPLTKQDALIIKNLNLLL